MPDASRAQLTPQQQASTHEGVPRVRRDVHSCAHEAEEGSDVWPGVLSGADAGDGQGARAAEARGASLTPKLAEVVGRAVLQAARGET